MTATLTTLPPGTVWKSLAGRKFPTQGQVVIDFIQQNCILTKDKWRGQPFALLPWQKRFLYEAFELNPDTGLRRYRSIYLEIPKKQGKTEMIAAIVLFLLIADNTENPEIACGSNSEDQADLVFGAAKAMCELSPTLSQLVACFRRQLVLRENSAAKVIRVSAKAKTNDGRNLSTVAEDELHEYDESGEQLHNVLTNGLATREQPINLMITTAGWDTETLCWRTHEHTQKVNEARARGEEIDYSFFGKIYAAPFEDVNLDDVPRLEEALHAANPSFGETVKLPFYLDERRKGLANFKRYYLNIWTGAENQWLPDGAWDECQGKPFELTPGAETFVGWDGSTHRDSSALAITQWEESVLRVKVKIWERPIEPATGKPVEGWRVPQNEIKDYLRELHKTYDLKAVAFDPAKIISIALDLRDEGLPMVETPPTPGRMVPATQGTYELILDRRLLHDGDATFARHIRNAVPKIAEGGGQRLTKTPDARPNDASLALVMAVGEALRREEAPEVEPEPFIYVMGAA